MILFPELRNTRCIQGTTFLSIELYTIMCFKHVLIKQNSLRVNTILHELFKSNKTPICVLTTIFIA